MADSNQVFLEMFSARERVARYAEGPPRFMPGMEAVHRMTQGHRHVFGDVVENDRHPTVLTEASLGGGTGGTTWLAARPTRWTATARELSLPSTIGFVPINERGLVGA